ncbi:hypothetical protein FQN49_000653 [Arthroderma sp. PD_2]|nr:hypothetical protein FQN49_000653 [Arthroderma sp. PD_2]
MAAETSKSQKTDHWSAEAYSASASFVPKLTETVIQYLNPQQHNKVLDVGCGDGKFTNKYIFGVASVLGIDSSPSMIESAKRDHGSDNADFRVVDCRYLDKEADIVDGTWDKVVSNAALHWILRDSTTRLSTLRAIFDSLKPGGSFVFEMGGHGNVPEVHTALLASLVQHGLSIEKAREISPWFFPSEIWMRNTLESLGFLIDKLETEYRPTKLTVGANGGIEGWVRLMGAPMLEALDSAAREDAVKLTCDLLESIITRHEDGSKWLGYVRLRGVAVKPGQN